MCPIIRNILQLVSCMQPRSYRAIQSFVARLDIQLSTQKTEGNHLHISLWCHYKAVNILPIFTINGVRLVEFAPWFMVCSNHCNTICNIVLDCNMTKPECTMFGHTYVWPWRTCLVNRFVIFDMMSSPWFSATNGVIQFNHSEKSFFNIGQTLFLP